MEASLFDYDLPAAAIAQEAAEPRDAARLLVVERGPGRVRHQVFRDLPGLLPPGLALFRNNARVLKARLRAQRPTGGAVECFLLRPHDRPDRWWCLLKPGRRLGPGATFGREGLFQAIVREKGADGAALVEFATDGTAPITTVAETCGEVPLPPYIARHAADPRSASDAHRYQTVYADPQRPVAVAAPTAGLHFTPGLLAELADRGHPAHDLTLHVGLGTFRPIQVERIEDHDMHGETYEIPPATRQALGLTPIDRRLAVGTTSLRALEDYHRRGGPNGPVEAAWLAEARLFLYPPATFHAGALLTNFHLPRSTLLCLVAAFLAPGSTDGIAWLRQLYAEALGRGYRFYSYGDAMLIL